MKGWVTNGGSNEYVDRRVTVEFVVEVGVEY